MNVDFIKTQSLKLFQNPLTEGKSTALRAAIVAFHALTLGIPLAVYYFVDYRFPKAEESAWSLKEIALKSLANEKIDSSLPVKGKIKPYSAVERAALSFAREKLNANPELKNCDFFDSFFAYDPNYETFKNHYVGRPLNPEIGGFTKLYRAYQKEIKDCLKNSEVDHFNDHKFLLLVDGYIKISYAIGVLTFEELDAFTDKMPDGEKDIIFSLARQDSYLFITVGFILNAYKFATRGGMWNDFHDKPGWNNNFPDERVNTEGTIQNSWKALYNAYCDRIRMYVADDDIKKNPKGDDRLLKASIRD